MNIAYIILAHKLPDQLIRLVRKLNTLSACFFIHIDKKTDSNTFEKIKTALREFDNVYFLDRYARYYGDYYHLKATLDALVRIKTVGVQFDYVVLLTGQDYPIKSNGYIQEFLLNAKGNSFLEYFSLPSDVWKNEDGGLDRIYYRHYCVRGRHFAFQRKNRLPGLLNPIWSYLSKFPPVRRKSPRNLTRFYGGSAYWCLSRACIEYLLNYIESNSSLVNFFEHVDIPEESFFQSILLNSPLAGSLINKNLWYILWSTAHHPFVLDSSKYEDIMSTDKLFARKFDLTVDDKILDKIDQAAP
jgi:hypothetical protein